MDKESELKHDDFNRLLRSLYYQDKETFNANPLKDEFDAAVDSVTYNQWIVERELRDMDGRMDPEELSKFIQSVGAEMNLDIELIENEVDDIRLEEIQEIYNDAQEMIQSGDIPIDMDNNVKSRQNEWFTEGFEAMYHTPFDYKQQARERAEDLRAGDEAEQGMADAANGMYFEEAQRGYTPHKFGDLDFTIGDINTEADPRFGDLFEDEPKRQQITEDHPLYGDLFADEPKPERQQITEDNPLYGDLFADEPVRQQITEDNPLFGDLFADEDDITVDSNIDDVIHRPEDLTEENRKELIDQAYMNSPRAVEFSTFIADMQVNNLTGLSESPLRHEFKEAVEDYTKATETLDEHLRDANGNIDGKAFETFITGIGHQLELPSILVNDTVELMSEDENRRLQDPSDKYEWFNEKYEQVYGEPFDYVVSANQYFEEKRREELNTTHSEESLETLYGVSFDAPVDAIDYTLENQAVATPYDSMVNFMSDVKDGRKPTDSKLKEAFEVSTNTMVDSWGVKQDNLVNDKGLFRDFMAQTIVMTSAESTKDNPLADRLSATDSQTVLNKTFGPDITPTAIESFTDGYKEVYDVPVDAYNLTMGEVASVMNRPEPEPIKSVLRYKDVFEADSIEALNALEDAVMAEVNREMDAEAKMYDAAAIDPEIEEDDDLEF